MSKRLVVNKAVINAAAVDTTGVIKTDRYTDMMIWVTYDRVSGAGAGTMTVYGSMDVEGTVKYRIGIKPTLTGTRDTDAAIGYTTDLTALYEIPGVHPYIFIDWNNTGDVESFTIDLFGVEDM